MFILAILAACGGTTLEPFVSQDLRGGKMAILPFDNLTESEGAGKSVENFMLVEFLKIPGVAVLDPGEVSLALSHARVRLATNIPKDTVITLGEELGADYLMIGTVHEFELQRMSGAGGSGEVPVISLSVRVVDAKTGKIVWAVNDSRSGKDNEKVFGIGRIQSIDELAALTTAELADSYAFSMK
jgi:TolB-like protein